MRMWRCNLQSGYGFDTGLHFANISHKNKYDIQLSWLGIGYIHGWWCHVTMICNAAKKVHHHLCRYINVSATMHQRDIYGERIAKNFSLCFFFNTLLCTQCKIASAIIIASTWTSLSPQPLGDFGPFFSGILANSIVLLIWPYKNASKKNAKRDKKQHAHF